MRFKWVGRWDSRNRVLRLFRVMYEKQDGSPYGRSTKIGVALAPRLFRWLDEGMDGWVLTVLGVRLSKHHAWGGRYV